jgi:hypothetical protein
MITIVCGTQGGQQQAEIIRFEYFIVEGDLHDLAEILGSGALFLRVEGVAVQTTRHWRSSLIGFVVHATCWPG